MFFKSAEHRSRFLAAVQGKVYDGKVDQEYAAALYILTAWEGLSNYVKRDGIDFPAILKEVDLSHGYSVLIRLAGNLFNGRTHTEPIELFCLDDRNFQVALTALQIRRVSLRVEDF